MFASMYSTDNKRPVMPASRPPFRRPPIAAGTTITTTVAISSVKSVTTTTILPTTTTTTVPTTVIRPTIEVRAYSVAIAKTGKSDYHALVRNGKPVVRIVAAAAKSQPKDLRDAYVVWSDIVNDARRWYDPADFNDGWKKAEVDPETTFSKDYIFCDVPSLTTPSTLSKVGCVRASVLDNGLRLPVNGDASRRPTALSTDLIAAFQDLQECLRIEAPLYARRWLLSALQCAESARCLRRSDPMEDLPDDPAVFMDLFMKVAREACDNAYAGRSTVRTTMVDLSPESAGFVPSLIPAATKSVAVPSMPITVPSMPITVPSTVASPSSVSAVSSSVPPQSSAFRQMPSAFRPPRSVLDVKTAQQPAATMSAIHPPFLFRPRGQPVIYGIMQNKRRRTDSTDPAGPT